MRRPSPPGSRHETPHAYEAVTELPPSDVRTITSGGADARIQDIGDAVRFHDYERALVLAHAVLRERPADVIALACIDECGGALEALHVFSSASLQRVPVSAITGPALYGLKLDHRAGFILSLVDGVSTVALILDMCPMPRPQALQVVFGLIKDGVLAFK